MLGAALLWERPSHHQTRSDGQYYSMQGVNGWGLLPSVFVLELQDRELVLGLSSYRGNHLRLGSMHTHRSPYTCVGKCGISL